MSVIKKDYKQKENDIEFRQYHFHVFKSYLLQNIIISILELYKICYIKISI